MKQLVMTLTLAILGAMLVEIAPAQTADELNRKAMELISKGNLNEAIEALQSATKTDSNYATTYINLGFLYYSNGMLEQAIALYAKALQLEPKNPLAHNNVGAALLAAGDYKRAILEYKLALKYEPNYPEAHNNLSYALNSVGAYDLAIEEATNAIDLKPDYARAFNNLGMAYHSKGQFDDAVLKYQKALELAPELIVALNNLGTTYRFQGKFTESIEQHKKAIALDSLNVESFNSMGLAFMNQGESKTAIDWFKKALEISPNYAITHNNLSYTYYDILDYAMAMQHASAAERHGLRMNSTYMEDLKKSLDPEFYRARHILVKTEAEAQAILVEIGKGEQFGRLALGKSLDKNSAKKGGDLGYFKKGDMMPDFEAAILAIKVGQVSKSVKTDLGYHLFQRLK